MHWDEVYRRSGTTRVSWYQAEPSMSLELLAVAGAAAGTRVVDVGGGASVLVDRLLDRGARPAVVDLSDVALRAAADRLGERATGVDWIVHDVLTWRPTRRYDVWHDRAVFHFLTDTGQREAYRATLDHAVGTGGHLVIGTFAADGPRQCSGLPVARYSPEELAAQFPGYAVACSRREEHPTPGGAVQPFTWLVMTPPRAPGPA